MASTTTIIPEAAHLSRSRHSPAVNYVKDRGCLRGSAPVAPPVLPTLLPSAALATPRKRSRGQTEAQQRRGERGVLRAAVQTDLVVPETLHPAVASIRRQPHWPSGSCRYRARHRSGRCHRSPRPSAPTVAGARGARRIVRRTVQSPRAPPDEVDVAMQLAASAPNRSGRQSRWRSPRPHRSRLRR